MAFTLQQLQAIENAIAKGHLKVAYDGRETTYRSMKDLRDARDLIRGELIATGMIVENPRSNRGPSTLTYFTRN